MSYVIMPTESYQTLCDKLREKTGGTDNLVASDIPDIIKTFGSAETLEAYLEGTLTSYSNDRITKIGAQVFRNITTLTNVHLPYVTSVGESAFHGCTKLTTVNAPNITSTGTQAFSGCTKLSSIEVTLFKTINTQAFYNCGFTTLNFPNVTTINAQGVRNCKKLTKVDLGSVATINAYSFDSCSLLETLIIRTGKICTLGNTNALSNTPIQNGTGYIYVPSALVESYKVATNWATYVNQFRTIEDYPEICGEA